MIPFTDKLFEDSSSYNNLVFEKVPVYTLEDVSLYTLRDVNPRSFGRGKRGIAGSMIFVQFDRKTLMETMADCTKASKGDL